MDAINAINALYILIFLHQTATRRLIPFSPRQLYILIFLHQTATRRTRHTPRSSCISLYSYIKPQQGILPFVYCHVVYPYIPTSNRNNNLQRWDGAHVVYPYIPTSNRNRVGNISHERHVVYPYIPTSNRNH